MSFSISVTYPQLQLGSIVFSVSTRSFDALNRRSEYRWPKIDRLNRRPAYQWLGVGEDKISLRGVVFPTLELYSDGGAVGVNQIEEMRRLAEQGIPQDLVTGTGRNMGKWVILSINEDQSAHMNDGNPRKQEYTLELAFYGFGNFGLDGIVFANGVFFTPRIQLNVGVNIGGLAVNANLGIGIT